MKKPSTKKQTSRNNNKVVDYRTRGAKRKEGMKTSTSTSTAAFADASSARDRLQPLSNFLLTLRAARPGKTKGQSIRDYLKESVVFYFKAERLP